MLALWPRVLGASRYEIQVGYVLAGSWRTCGGTKGECTFLIQGLEHQQRYVCRVRAFDEDSACWGPYSASSLACRYDDEEKSRKDGVLASVSGSLDNDVDTTTRRRGSTIVHPSTPPSSSSSSAVSTPTGDDSTTPWPTHVTFSSMDATGLLARWKPVANATAYEIQVGSASRFAVGWRTVGGTSACQYVVQALKPGMKYVCRVRALLSSSGAWGAYSSWSNAASFSAEITAANSNAQQHGGRCASTGRPDALPTPKEKPSARHEGLAPGGALV